MRSFRSESATPAEGCCSEVDPWIENRLAAGVASCLNHHVVAAEMCAQSLKDVEQAAWELIASQPKIMALEPNSLEDV